MAFPVISYFVDHIEPFQLDLDNYELKHRNGMPMVVNDKSTAPIEGYLIYFNDNLDKVCLDEEKWIYRLYDAYKYIDYTKPDKLFKWKTIEHNGITFNMTLGKNRDYGVSYKSNKGNYDGRNDPNFMN